MVLTQTHHFAS